MKYLKPVEVTQKTILMSTTFTCKTALKAIKFKQYKKKTLSKTSVLSERFETK
ncbi:hypothetical protein FBALC1_15937 [Flavobacteriales bacterium ALC-1]|nr:hypothetical protein FBALC1_15937 [Flavobacteriales bacterium ALC-1]